MISNQINSIKKLIIDRKITESNEEIFNILKELSQTINELGKDNAVILEFNEILSALEESIAIEDTIMTIDILQYVLLQFVLQNNLVMED